MRIALGVEALAPQLTGIGRYTWELACRLPNVAGVEDLKFFRAGTWHDDAAQFLDDMAPTSRPTFLSGRLPRKVQTWFNRREFSRRLYHGPNFFFPAQAENAVITVHDLSVFRFPETHPVERIRQFEQEFYRSIEGARHIITDTIYIKDELSGMFGLDPARITAVPLGVSETFFEVGDEQGDAVVLREHGLHAIRYCLCVATIEPRKGLDHAVKAFLKYRERTGCNEVLVIIGAAGWNNSELHKLFEDASATGGVRFLGFVSDPALRAIYRHCSLFVYPSLYEGFGLPVLEAMASGVPTLVSNRSCLPEVSGGVAMSIDVEDHDAFEEALGRGLEDEHWRPRAVEDGLALARRLNWENCARATAQVYARLA